MSLQQCFSIMGINDRKQPDRVVLSTYDNGSIEIFRSHHFADTRHLEFLEFQKYFQTKMSRDDPPPTHPLEPPPAPPYISERRIPKVQDGSRWGWGGEEPKFWRLYAREWNIHHAKFQLLTPTELRVTKCQSWVLTSGSHGC